ncbi:MAG TPA: hypothetical protein VGB45_09230 [Abditibacterium sp.]|jgi:hypothetical protein
MKKSATTRKSFDQGHGRCFVFLAFWLYAFATKKSNDGILLTLPLLFIILSQIVHIKKDYFSTMDMIWLCMMIFFVVAPLQSLDNGIFKNAGQVSMMQFSTHDLWKAMTVVLLSTLSFIVGIHYSKYFSNIKDSRFSLKTIQIELPQSFLLIAISLICSFLYIRLSGGIINVLSPRELKESVDASIVPPLLVALHSVTNSLLAIGMLNCAKKHKTFFFVAFLFSSLLLALILNPFNSARFQLIASWLPTFMCLLGVRLTYTKAYSIFLFGLMVAMPVMSLTTRLGTEGLTQIEGSTYSQDVFTIKDVDIFDTLVHGVKMADAKEYGLGDNVKAIILFFVPRKIWPDKPIVGGLIVGKDLLRFGAGTSNLSYFIGGDLYMDFGYMGVFLGSVLIGFCFNIFFRTSKKDLCMDELFLIASIPILLRGPVGAIIGYFVCICLSLRFYEFLFSLKSFITQKPQAFHRRDFRPQRLP